MTAITARAQKRCSRSLRCGALARPIFANLSLGILLGSLLSGCSQQGRPLDIFGSFGTNELGVPYDKMPPPGLCRVWYPNRQPRNQPPIGDCDYLAARLPTGAQLIRGGTPGGNFESPQPGIRESSLFGGGAVGGGSGSGNSYPPQDPARGSSPDSYGSARPYPPADAGSSPAESLEQRRMDDLNRRY